MNECCRSHLKGDEVLAHHGILGMHWGVRRFQTYDAGYQADHTGKFVGHLKKTSVDRKGYKTDVASKQRNAEKASAKYTDALLSRSSDPETVRKLKKAADRANGELYFEKQKESAVKDTNISERRKQIEDTLVKLGATKEEAAAYAKTRAVAEKLVAGMAIATVASLAAYSGYKLYQNYGDNIGGIIPAGTSLTRVAANGNQGVHDAFFASLSKNKKDVRAYVGMYGSTLNGAGVTAYEKKIRLNDAIRVAGRKDAAKVVSDLFDNDKNFKDALLRRLRDDRFEAHSQGQLDLMKKFQKGLETGKMDKKVLYDYVNYSLVSRKSGLSDKVYAALKDKGYGAIVDMNDRKYSGYNTKRPLIIFDNSKAVVESVKKLGKETIKEANEAAEKHIVKQETVKQMVNGLLNDAGKMSLFTGVAAATAAGTTTAMDKTVEKYRKEHPGTKMSYREILDNTWYGDKKSK